MENIDTKNNWDWRIYCNNKSCDFSVELKSSNLKTFFDEKFGKEIFESKKDYDINIFSHLYDEIMCGICENFPLTVINNKHEMVLDPDKIIPCEQCQKPILLTRLKIKKGTKICTPCARKDELTDVEKIKIHNDKAIPKSPPIPPDMTTCEKCGKDSTTRYVQSSGTWFLGCSTFPTCWWRKSLPQTAEIVGANLVVNLKGSANDLLYAAKEATKVNNIKVLKDIHDEMIYRQENRIIKGKAPNRRLNQYVEAVTEYLKSLKNE